MEGSRVFHALEVMPAAIRASSRYYSDNSLKVATTAFSDSVDTSPERIAEQKSSSLLRQARYQPSHRFSLLQNQMRSDSVSKPSLN